MRWQERPHADCLVSLGALARALHRDGAHLGYGYQLDVRAAGYVVAECLAIRSLEPVHELPWQGEYLVISAVSVQGKCQARAMGRC